MTFLGKTFSDIAFNPYSKNFYAARESSKTILVYAYDYNNQFAFRTFNNYAYRQAEGSILQLYYQNNNVITITKNDSVGNQIEVIPVPASSEASPNLAEKPYIPINFTPDDLIFDPSRPTAYMTSSTEKKLYAYNYDTKQTTSLSVDDIPQKIVMSNGKLYVSLVKLPFVDWNAFPDALSGSALAALSQHPIILVSPTMSQDYIENLKYNKNMMKLKYITGGTGVIPDSLIDKIFE